MKVLVIGGGISGSTTARILAENGCDVDVFERRSEIGGNCSDRMHNGIMISKHGAHIFHTNEKQVWDWVNKFGEFHHYTHQVQAWCNDEIHSPLPINMNTMMDYVDSISEAKDFIEGDRVVCPIPMNLEEACLDKFGKTLYNRYIKHYSEKQWGRPCTEIPPSIINRIPLRFTFDNRYFTDKYQGIPTLGYSNLIESMLAHSKITTYVDKNVDLDDLKILNDVYDSIVYCGALDELFEYKHGELEYRSLKFKYYGSDTVNLQGCAVVNHVGYNTSSTRSIEWRHFMKECKEDYTMMTTETPQDYKRGENEPYYPIGSEVNIKKYNKYYKDLLELSNNILPLGRMAQYKYLDMDKAVLEAMKVSDRLLTKKHKSIKYERTTS